MKVKKLLKQMKGNEDVRIYDYIGRFENDKARNLRKYGVCTVRGVWAGTFMDKPCICIQIEEILR